MRLLKVSAVLAFVGLMAYAPTVVSPTAAAATGAQLESIGALTFGPNGVMFAADGLGGKIYALTLGTAATGGAPGTANVEGITGKIAALLGTDAAQVAITDLVVEPTSHNSFIAVMRGQGPAAKPALVRVDGAGKITNVALDTLQFTSVDLPNLPASAEGRGGNQRARAITQVKFNSGRVWVSGLSNEEFASKLWSAAYPFTKADVGTSLEIYHGNHQRLETRAPMYAFLPLTIENQPYIVGAYTCTPLVKFPVSQLTSGVGTKYRGTTIAEFGAGNQPLDMIPYTKGGQSFILMSNTTRGVMKFSTATFGSAAPIATPVTTPTGGVPYETIASMTGVLQLDLLDATHSVVIAGANLAAANLQSVELP